MEKNDVIENSIKKPWYKCFPHALFLLFLVIVFCGALSYIIPAGQFDRIKVAGKTIVKANSFHYVKSSYVSIFDIFRAIPNGMVNASNIMFLILLVGGSIEIFSKTGAINAGLITLIRKLGDKGEIIVIVSFTVFFALLGGFLGWIEAAFPFVPLAMAVICGMGYDTLVGVSVCTLGMILGFTAGPTSVYSVGIAQSIAELPLFSGIGFRIVIFITLITISVVHIYKYAKKIKRNPSLSIMKDIDTSDLNYNLNTNEDIEFTLTHKLVLLILCLTFIVTIIGMTKFKWNMNDMSATFVIGSIIAGIISKMTPNKIAENFSVGFQNIAFGALIVGVARGVQWILLKGNIVDTIIYSTSLPLSKLPKCICVIGMFIVQAFINFFIPSGSGQAIVTMPLMVPLSDLLGITRQTAILAFQLGDGFSNIIWFTYGGLMFLLASGKIPYNRWLKFIWPVIWKVFLASSIFLIIAVNINYGPF
ncbi:YfcC family protein [Clostridium niameyense]|uniref:YfcC family protein n=1 Tax=Clostridium niameyense TaxID=1622073 RepID=UPI00067EBD49|nr:TIGR00366 family protein [Clostridium niameyense]